MNEIYWLSRLDSIVTVFGVTLTISAICLVFFGIMSFVDPEGELVQISTRRNVVRRSMIITVISLLIVIFIPTSKQAMAIYGIGKTLDYVQQNENLHELPDKCVKALEAWVDSLELEE